MKNPHKLGCAQSFRLNMLNKYAAAPEFFARFASEPLEQPVIRVSQQAAKGHSTATANKQERSGRGL
jgi:hypothetical protein